MDHLLDTMGLGDANFNEFGKAIKFWGDSTGGIHFSVTVFIESSLCFDVPKCVSKFVFKFVGGVFIDDTICTSVHQ